MPARHPASDPSHLPPRGPDGSVGPSASRAQAPRPAVFVGVGFLVGAGLVALPFLMLGELLTSGLGLWLAFVGSSALVFVVLALGLGLHRASTRARGRAVGAGMLLALALIGLLLGWGIGYYLMFRT